MAKKNGFCLKGILKCIWCWGRHWYDCLCKLFWLNEEENPKSWDPTIKTSDGMTFGSYLVKIEKF
jgi:hypothetical protein